MKASLSTHRRFIMAQLTRRAEPWFPLEDDESIVGPTKRGRLVKVCVGFLVAAVVFPTVMLAAMGHFSSSPGTTDSEPSLGTNQNTIGASSPSAEPSQTTPLPTPSPPTRNPPSLSPIWLTSTDAPTQTDSRAPTSMPSGLPTDDPSKQPSAAPTALPTRVPTLTPTLSPSAAPVPVVDAGELSSSPSSIAPSSGPTSQTTFAPTPAPTPSPTSQPTALDLSTSSPTALNVTYQPGQLTVNMVSLYMSTGLTARIVARHRQKVQLHDGTFSNIKFHERPDFGATYPVPGDDATNPGGWVYVSNSEMLKQGQGGVGAVTFDRHGNTLNYKMILTGTTMNCGGGSTPWDTWVSCEEWTNKGEIYQVDPFGRRTPAKLTMGAGLGRWESFSYDVRDRAVPRFFATEDHERGALRRFTPANPDWDDPWTMLHGEGTLDYLVLEPDGNDGGAFRWVAGLGVAKDNANLFYPNTEGIDIKGSELFMVAKRIKQLFILNLDDMTYQNQTTRSGLFDGAPDQVQSILDDHDILYFTEEGGRDAGIHGRNSAGQFFTILESRKWEDETTGLAFSPDGRHMYVAYQETGILYDVTREDGLAFHGRSLNVKYHGESAGRR